jgi:hypothetical protein
MPPVKYRAGDPGTEDWIIDYACFTLPGEEKEIGLWMLFEPYSLSAYEFLGWQAKAGSCHPIKLLNIAADLQLREVVCSDGALLVIKQDLDKYYTSEDTD